MKKFVKKALCLGGIGYAALFAVFFFDLDGKLLFNVVEPFLKNHYDNMERKDMHKTPYDMQFEIPQQGEDVAKMLEKTAKI